VPDFFVELREMNKSALLPTVLLFTALAVLVGALPIGCCAGLLFSSGDWPRTVLVIAAGILAAMFLGGTLFVLAVLATKTHGATLKPNYSRNNETSGIAYRPGSRQYIATAQ
jgi:hypothetical protein